MALSLVRALALLAALALAGLAAWRLPAGFAAFEARLFDLGWRLSADGRPEERLVLIDIDEKSLAELGPWPWPRERLARLAERLGEAGVALQVWDLVLDTPREGDAALAAALNRSRAVLSAAFAFPGQGEAVDVGRLDPSATLPCTPPWPIAHGQRAPAASFAGLPVGHIAPRVDADGLVRALPAYVCRAGRAWPALPLAAWLAVSGAAQPRLEAGVGPFAPAWRLVAAGLPEAIPLGAAGELYVPYTLAAESFIAISAADLLAGRAPAAPLAGRIALVGSTAFGLADVVATPHAGAASALLVHAELLAGLLDGRLVHPPRAAAGLAAALALLAMLPLWLLAQGRPAAWALPAAGLGLGLLLLLAQLALQRQGWLVGLAWPALAALLAGLALGMVEHARAALERGRLLTHLASFLPAPVALRLLHHQPKGEVSAEMVEASVMVADLRNFTAWSETQPAEAVAALLHRFLAVATEIVEAQGGLVEGLEGDAVLAIWNGLAPCPDHAERALAAARALHARVSAELPAGDPDGIPPPLALGIGLDAGPVLVGALGPRQRRQHLALGLPVTRAVRLATLSAELASPILVGPGVVARLSEGERAALLRQGEFLLEGLIAPCEIHALL